MSRTSFIAGMAVLVTFAGLLAPSAASAQRATTADLVRIPIPRDDGTLTPYTFEAGYPLVTLVYDTLLWRGSGGDEEWLANTVRKSDASKRITIELRKGVRWHDGKPLTAEDVAFTFKYFATHFHPRFTPELEAVLRAEAIDEQTVEITLKHPSPGFNDQPLSDLPILPKHLWEGLPKGSVPKGLPVGSGPYRLVEHRRGKGYRFRANPSYYLGRPRVKTIEVSFIGDFERTVRALQGRRIDMIPYTLTESAEARLKRSVFKTATGTYFTGTTLMFNLRRPPFNKAAARRAVASALDLQRIARAKLIGPRNATAADSGFLHPASGWTTPGVVYRFEENRARAALAALKLPRISVMAPDNDPVKREAGRQVVLALERVGASARLEVLPAGRLAAAVGENGSSPTFEAAIASSPALASFDPDYLRSVFGSHRAPLNYSGYRSAEFDRLAAQEAAELNPRKRRELVKSELNLLAKDAPVVPLLFQKGAFVYRPQIYDGWVYADGTGILDKLSFLPHVIRSAGGDSATPVGSQGGDSGVGVLGIIAIGLLCVAAVVVGLGFVAKLRNR